MKHFSVVSTSQLVLTFFVLTTHSVILPVIAVATRPRPRISCLRRKSYVVDVYGEELLHP